MSNEINSKKFWEEYFKTKWEICRGREQTEYFMQLIIENLPENVKKYIGNPKRTILDWGCALGQGVNFLRNTFPDSKVKGLDFSDIAIEKAKNEYLNLSFTSGTLSEVNEKFSVIICSNCLEHFADPESQLKEHLEYTKDIYIALVPYKEENLIESHEISLDEDFFPDEIEPFRKIHSKTLDTRSSGFWDGYQLLVIYANKSLSFDAMEKNDNKLINSQSPELWDDVAETYSETADTAEIKLGQEIEQLLLELGIEPGASLLEVGCGSGHLSGYLAGKDFQTTLIDFSKVALEKAKKHYEQNNLIGTFIHADMFDLSADLVEPHDVVWNSGVLEHFDAWKCIDVLKKMGQVARKYILVLVPNAKSIPYLLFRKHAMENGEWIWGRELLRDSMKHLAEAANLEVIEEEHIGKHFSYGHMTYVNSEVGSKYQDLDQELIPQEQNYLIALIARPKNKEIPSNYEKVIEDALKKESKIETDTYYFDFSSLNFYLEKNKDKIGELSHKIGEVQNLTTDLKAQLEEKNSQLNELQVSVQSLTADFESRLEEKDLKTSKLQDLTVDLNSRLEDQKNEILDLKETLNQRESSLSWRFSQYYGRYFSIHSPVTKVASSFLNRMIGSKESKLYSDDSSEEKNLHILELKNILKEYEGRIKGIIIYPPTVDWNIPLFQRPQQIALQFSKMGYLFFFSTGSNELDRVDGFRKIEDRCYITNRYDLLVNELSKFILLFSSTNLVITLNDVQNIRDRAFIIYEYIDEISEAISGESVDNIIRRHKYLIKHSDVVLATADKLFEDVTKIRQKDVYLNPNGVDYEHFHIVRDTENIPSDLRSIVKKGNPIIGYYGAFATWFDYKLIIELAEKRPNYEIVLIGWDYDNSMKNQKLDYYNNIHYLGVIKYPVLPEYAIWFDVATIPFVLNKITESTSPIKIFEYMALGMPIVTTDMRECRKYKSVLIGKSYEEFIQKIDEGLELKKNDSYLELLDKEAKENTWDMRAKKIDEYINLSRH